MLIAFAANAYDFQSGGIYYKINSGGSSVTVTTGDSGFLYSGTISIPATVTNNGKTYNVTAIGANTFKQCSELESITIGSKVKFIDDYAFTNCSALKAVSIPNSVESMGTYYGCIFEGCSNLNTVTIGTGLKAIPSRTFAGTPINRITIPGNVETIGSDAFNSCSHLTQLTIEEGVVNINSGAFRACSTLEKVVIPNTVKTISDNAFKNCVEMEELTLGSNVKFIDDYAFTNCSALKAVSIPNSVESMGTYYGCIFEGCSNLNTVTIGTGLKAIPSRTFAGTPINRITIPGNVETIGSDAFNSCSHLTQLTIEEGVVNINSGAFRACSTLEKVVIPNTVKTISDNAFKNCVEMEELTLGSNVKTLGDYAFQNCNAFKTITSCNETAPQMSNEACFTVYGSAKLYIPLGSSDSYMSTNYWNKFTDVIEKKMDNNGPVVGDVNGDGEVNIADVNFIIDLIIRG